MWASLPALLRPETLAQNPECDVQALPIVCDESGGEEPGPMKWHSSETSTEAAQSDPGPPPCRKARSRSCPVDGLIEIGQ
jgi:hypothetical protein